MTRTPRMHALLLLVFAGTFAPTVTHAQTETVTYFHTDAIGSVRMVTDEMGAVLARYDYQPFGLPLDQVPPPPTEQRQFAGKERDSETEFDYFGARYYASANGRFTTVDPMLDIEQAMVDPQRWNRYAYSLNNPLKFTDPDGRSPKLVILALKAGHALYKSYDIYSTVEGTVDAGRTVISPDATAGERVWAGLQLAGELSGVTDVLKAGRGALNAVDSATDPGRRATSYVDDFATTNTKLWSGTFKSEGEARALARTKLGSDAVEISPGKWRSGDGKWQYRAKPGDVSRRHIHLEELDPRTGEVLQNAHLYWLEGSGR